LRSTRFSPQEALTQFTPSKFYTGEIPLPIVGPDLKDNNAEGYVHSQRKNKFRGCFSSLTRKSEK